MSFRLRKEPPANEADFERLCLRLLKAYWNCPTLELFGRRGEGQQGIDVLDMNGTEPLRAAQCKLYNPKTTLPPAEIRAEVEAAKSFEFKIGIFALMTTAKISTAAQKTIIEINRDHREAGLLAIELFTWDRIDELLEEYPTIRDQEYKTLSGETVRQLQETIADVNVRLSSIQVNLSGESEQRDDALHAQIDEARALIQKGEFQTGRFLLQRLRTSKWDRLGPRHRYRVLSNIGAAYLQEGETSKAAESFLEGAAFQPDDVQAAENEGLAYQLSLTAGEAFEQITRLRDRFPNSSRIVAQWATSAPSEWTAEQIKDKLPATQVGASEVVGALAARFLSDSNFRSAEELAKRCIEQLPKWSFPRLIRARAYLLKALPALSQVSETEKKQLLGTAEELFSDSIKAAIAEHNGRAHAESLLGRAQALMLLDDTSGAESDIRSAEKLFPEEENVKVASADLKLRTGRVDEAVAELRAITTEGFRPDTAILLFEALRMRGDKADRPEVIGILRRILALPGRVMPGQREYLSSVLILQLADEQRWDEAEEVCNGLADEGVSEALLDAYRGRLAHLQGNSSAANNLASAAVAALSETAPREEIRWIAQLCSEIGRHSDALPLWLRVAARNKLAEDTKELLNCAMRLGRDDVILEACEALRASGILEQDLILYEVHTREKYDVDGTVTVLRDYLKVNPDDRNVKLRLSVIGVNWNRPEIMDARPEVMPSVETVDAARGLAAVQVMKLGGYPKEALSYGYQLLRRNFDKADAHRAFMFNLHPINPRPDIAEFTEVGIGSAVAFVEEGETQVRWAVIEDGPSPDSMRSEYHPSHPIAKALIGKKVGDLVVLVKGSISERNAKITAIQSKYVYRYQDCGNNWQIRFPDVPILETMKIKTVTRLGREEPDLSAVFALVEQQSANNQQLLELYRSMPVPIHLFGSARGKSTIESTLALAQQEDSQVLCALGSADERQNALASLEVASTIVIEPSALATILLLKLESILSSFPVSKKISQGTLAQVNEMLREDTLFGGEGGVLTKAHDRVAFIQVTAAQREERGAALSRWIESLKNATQITACLELAGLDPDRRIVMIKSVGEGGAESIMLAAKPGHVLWTDDIRLANFARTEFAVKSVWTQVLLQSATSKGYMSEELFVRNSALLIGFGYSFTSPSVPVLVAAAKIADWDRSEFPLRAALDQLSSGTIDVRDAANLALGFMQVVYREPIMGERRRSITWALLDALASRSRGVGLTHEIRAAIPIVFGVNVLGADEAVQSVDTWLKRRPIRL